MIWSVMICFASFPYTPPLTSVAVITSTNGTLIGSSTNFFRANSNLLNSAVNVYLTNQINYTNYYVYTNFTAYTNFVWVSPIGSYHTPRTFSGLGTIGDPYVGSVEAVFSKIPPGSVINLLPGTFKMSCNPPTAPHSYTKIVGAGIGTTTLLLDTNQPVNFNPMFADWFYYLGTNATAITNWTIQDLTIDLGGWINSNCVTHGLIFYNTNKFLTMRRVEVIRQYGMHAEDYPNSPTRADRESFCALLSGDYSLIEGCKAWKATGTYHSGLSVSGYGSRITGCYGNIPGSPWTLSSGGGQNIWIDHNILDNCGIYTDSGCTSNTIISDNFLTGSNAYIWYASGGDYLGYTGAVTIDTLKILNNSLYINVGHSGGSAIAITTTSGGRIRNIEIANNYISTEFDAQETHKVDAFGFYFNSYDYSFRTNMMFENVRIHDNIITSNLLASGGIVVSDISSWALGTNHYLTYDDNLNGVFNNNLSLEGTSWHYYPLEAFDSQSGKTNISGTSIVFNWKRDWGDTNYIVTASAFGAGANTNQPYISAMTRTNATVSFQFGATNTVYVSGKRLTQ